MAKKKNIELQWFGKSTSSPVETIPREEEIAGDVSSSFGEPSAKNMLIHGDSLEVLTILNQNTIKKSNVSILIRPTIRAAILNFMMMI